jgi:hypothetical protein
VTYNNTVKDKYYDLTKGTFIKEGRIITHDPNKIMLGKRRGYINLGAGKGMIVAEKEDMKIAVEVKSFLGSSDLDDALGQFLIHWKALKTKEFDKISYLAVLCGFTKDFLMTFSLLKLQKILM